MQEDKSRYSIMYICNEGTLGGAAQSLLDMLKGFENRVHAVVVIPCKGLIEDRLKELNIPCYVVPFTMGHCKIGTGSAIKSEQNIKDNYVAALKLQDIIRDEKIQLIHINSSVSNVGAFAALMAGIPYIWHIREVLEEQFGYEFMDNELKAKLLIKADCVITISKTVQRHCEVKFNVKSFGLYNGLDIGKYTNPVIDMMEEYNRNFIIPGAICEAKGQLEAIKAVEILLRQGIEDVRLYIVGPGGPVYQWKLNRYIKSRNLNENITILPFSGDLSQLRRKCTFAITSSVFEAMGRTTVEAMLAGNVIIGADTAGTKEIIGEDRKKGLLYRQGDADSLASAMKTAINMTDKERFQMLTEAQKFAIENFDSEKYDEKILDIYEQVINGYHKEEDSSLLATLKERYKLFPKDMEDVSSCNSINTKSRSQIIYELKERVCERKEGILQYLVDNNIHSISIYGMGILGCYLYDIFEEQGMEIPYVIDKNSKEVNRFLKAVGPNDLLEPVDMLVVTVAGSEEEIAKIYRDSYPNIKVIGVTELIESVYG